jgi:uncharacterized membrane protein YjgN (DUF898 family)
MNPRSEPASVPQQTYRLAFTGSASEYFRIWIINVFLTVITLGVYYAWAKVRTRQYFYAHTTLDGHAFDYLAHPIAILKGHLIVAAGVVVFFLSQQLMPELNGLVVLGFYAVMPYLIYKSLRFRLYHSTYRNIRMHFHGSLKESYRVHCWWPMLIPLTLGLLLPYLAYLKKQYVFDHVAYGMTRLTFGGQPKPFYYIYLGMLGISLLFVVIVITLFSLLTDTLGESVDMDAAMMSMLFPLAYLLLIFMTSTLQQYLYAHMTNYCWNHSSLGHVRFHSTLKMWPLVVIRVTNLLAIIGSAGLLIPWARIRRTRYLLNHLQLIVRGDLDHFAAAQGQEDHALGDVSADFLDIEVGL